MKKTIRLLGIIAVVAVIGLLVSCGELGGTLEVQNASSYPAVVRVSAGLNVLSKGMPGDTISAGSTKTYTLDLDSDVTVLGVGSTIFSKTVTVSKGQTVTVTID
ncbi:MAG: hypothetical protein LBH97_01100 [Treponema sp.]|nr:hypothetical protein [Treponema sp.]